MESLKSYCEVVNASSLSEGYSGKGNQNHYLIIIKMLMGCLIRGLRDCENGSLTIALLCNRMIHQTNNDLNDHI